MISPTHMKDYRNPHIAQIWYHADRLLRRAKRVFFIGYSMPPDDVDVIYLLKRGLVGLPAEDITVVEFDPDDRPAVSHPAGQGFARLFGSGIRWYTGGFERFARDFAG